MTVHDFVAYATAMFRQWPDEFVIVAPSSEQLDERQQACHQYVALCLHTYEGYRMRGNWQEILRDLEGRISSMPGMAGLRVEVTSRAVGVYRDGDADPWYALAPRDMQGFRGYFLKRYQRSLRFAS